MKSAKKPTLFHGSAHFFRFYLLLPPFLSHFGPFGSLLGGFGGPWLSCEGPLGPHEYLNLRSYPHPGSGAIANSIWQILGFLESAKTITPKPKLMEDGTRAKVKKSINVFVSYHAFKEMKYQKVYDRWKGI